MNNLLNVFFVFQIIISVLLVVIVIFQKTSEDSLSGIGGGMSNNGVMSKRAVTNILTKGTMILVALFMLNCLFMSAVIARTHGKNESKIEEYIEENDSDSKSLDGGIQIPEGE
jgi:protein translocase SecG subunit